MAAEPAIAEPAPRRMPSLVPLGAAVAAALPVVVAAIALTTGGPAPGAAQGVAGSPRPAASLASVGAVAAVPTTAMTPSPPSTAPVATAPASPPTPASASPAASAKASIEVGQRVVRSWIDPYGEVRAEVIVAVRNAGPSPAFLPSSETSYAVSDPAGREVAGGVFTYAFPRLIAPGQTAYLVDALSATFVERGDLARVDVEVGARPALPAASGLVVSGVRVEPKADAGIVATGIVRNDGSTPVRNGIVGVVVHDRAGGLLAVVYDLTDAAVLQPGEERAFSTSYPAAPPVDAAAIGSIEAFAVDDQP